VHVDTTLPAVHAAEIAAKVIGEMQAKGYTMPNAISVISAQSQEAVFGPAGVTQIAPPTAGGHSDVQLALRIPATMPANADLDKAVAVAFGGRERDSFHGDVATYHDKFAARTMQDVVVHEMGHVQMGYKDPSFADARSAFHVTDDMHGDKQLARILTTATRSVSGYASRNASDFIAEAFTRQYRGETLSADAATLYKALGGPAIK
jgi:hypothetical protein